METKYVMRQVDNIIYFVSDENRSLFDEAMSIDDGQSMLYKADVVIDADTRFVRKARRF